MKEEIVFYERQRFKQWWIFLLFTASFVFLLFSGKLSGDNQTDYPVIIGTIVFLTLLSVGFFFVRLDTVINKDGVYFRMFPFHFKSIFINWEQILEAEIRRISPIREHGGWGMRFKVMNIGSHGISYGFGRKAYTISGNHVLQLRLNNNKKIIIGTKKPDELTEFLNKLDAERKQK